MLFTPLISIVMFVFLGIITDKSTYVLYLVLYVALTQLSVARFGCVITRYGERNLLLMMMILHGQTIVVLLVFTYYHLIWILM